jgi:predicted phosphodiesterase
MKTAILSDIHGNTLALDAILADIQAQGGVEGYIILGDLVAIGPDPVGVLERIKKLPNVACVHGNTDRFTVTGDRPPPSQEDVRVDPSKLQTLVDNTATFAWTLGTITQAGWLDWVTNLPLEIRLTLPDGTRLLGVHAAPGKDDGYGFPPDVTEAKAAEMVNGCDADLVLVGHTHKPIDLCVKSNLLQSKGIRIFNPGSLSNPLLKDLSANYAILEANESGYTLQRCHATYDIEALIKLLEKLRHPHTAYITRHLRGQADPHPRSKE